MPLPFRVEVAVLYARPNRYRHMLFRATEKIPRGKFRALDSTGIYWYAAQFPPTDGQSSLAPLLILTSSSLRNPIGLSVRIARRYARPLGCLPAGLRGN